MSDFSSGWRPSANLSFAPPNDPLRREMMARGYFEPDEDRVARGALPMSAANRDTIGRQLANEAPLGDDTSHWFDHRSLPERALGPPAAGLPQQPLGQGRALAALGAQPFMHRNDLAVSDAAIGDLLQGRAAPPSGFLGTLGQIGGVYSGASPLEHLNGPPVPFGSSTGWPR